MLTLASERLTSEIVNVTAQWLGCSRIFRAMGCVFKFESLLSIKTKVRQESEIGLISVQAEKLVLPILDARQCLGL